MKSTFADATTHSVDTADCAFLYREVGAHSARPLVMLQHVTGVLEDWDPAVIDGLAEHHRVILFDNRGVGGSSGVTPQSIAEMARDAIAFICALGLSNVDIVGFSMGGFIAQVIACEKPDLVRRMILAGTGPAGGEGIRNVGAVIQQSVGQSSSEGRHPKQILFFSQSADGQQAAEDFLGRLNARQQNRDLQVSNDTVAAHIAAAIGWGSDKALGPPLHAIKQPVLVVNGDNDIMVPTVNSLSLFRDLPNAELSIFPDAGHGAIFQYHREFLAQAARFLGTKP